MRWPQAGWVLSCAVAALLAAPAVGQVSVFTTNGFESSAGYTLGNIDGQQGFVATPPDLFNPTPTLAGQVASSLTFGGSGQALQVVGNQLVDSGSPPFGYNGGNFWYRSYTSGPSGTGFRPQATGNPIVRATAQVRTSGAVMLAGNDMPFAGLHFEGFTAGGAQQVISPIYVNLNGGITVFTNSATTTSLAVTTADGLVSREQWHQLTAEFNFSAQTFRVYIDGSTTPVLFTRDGNNQNLTTPRTDVPFRNTNGQTVQFAEIGVLAFYGRDLDLTPYQPHNDFFVDDYTVVAAPVPEPGSLVAIGFAALAIGGWLRRRKA